MRSVLTFIHLTIFLIVANYYILHLGDLGEVYRRLLYTINTDVLLIFAFIDRIFGLKSYWHEVGNFLCFIALILNITLVALTLYFVFADCYKYLFLGFNGVFLFTMILIYLLAGKTIAR